MKALSIKQPYAEAIMAGVKREEYRSWPTSHRGALLIHAGATRATKARLALYPDLDVLVYGAVIGQVEVLDCVLCEDGGFAWKLSKPRRFKTPLVMSGRLGLWDVPDELVGDLI